MPHIPRAICVPCGKEYRIKKNSFEVLMQTRGKPYYQISTDMWECPVCGHQVVVGFAQAPYWQNFMSERTEIEPNLRATFSDE